MRDFAIQRVRGILVEIQNLKNEDFPYDHALEALEEIESRVQQRIDLLASLTDDDDADAVDRVCGESLEQNFKLLPLLGFIVWSTSVRKGGGWTASKCFGRCYVSPGESSEMILS